MTATQFARTRPLIVAVGAVAVMLGLRYSTVGSPQSPAAAVTRQGRDQLPEGAKYRGVAACKDCHGHAEPTPVAVKPRSSETEYTTWKEKDKHSTAYRVLENDASKRMAALLKLDKPPHQSDRCLNCHSMHVLDPARRSSDSRDLDGVSCDGCHGPSSLWLDSHRDPDVAPELRYADSVKKGMKDIRSPVVRAEMCLSCHLGNRDEGKVVDHEMYAAGHPPLVFEVDAFSQKLPPHWREKGAAEDGSSLPRAQTWAAGQLVALREAAEILVDDAKSGRWPEYSHFDCSSCHHDLDDNPWRQRRPPFGPPGRPAWQGVQSAGTTSAIVGSDALADALRGLDRQFATVPFGRLKEVEAAAAHLAARLNELVQAAQGKSISASDAKRLAVALCDLAEPIASRGPAAAQQLAFAVHALLSQSMPADSAAAKDAVGLVNELAAPQAKYDPLEFGGRIEAIRKQIQ